MLNSEQKKAVTYHKGPLLIVAGAGTGKTTVIVEKIKYIIKKKLAHPQEILALTFTEKAAAEMEERVDREMPYGFFQMEISTFHAFADSILKEEAPHIGLSPAFKLMTEAENIIFLRKNLFAMTLKYFRPLGNPNKFLENLLQHFSRLKDEDVSPAEYLMWAKAQSSKSKVQNEEERIEAEKYLELATAYQKYQDLKEKENLFDFSDLIYYLIKLFRSRKNILKKYQQKYKYILVDEFQDTNIAQYNLIKLLIPAESNPNLTVVGDDSQAIYKFRGASVSNILNFISDYKKSKQITLIKNYRSHQKILDAAYRLIKHNDPDTLESRLGISKKLIAATKSKVHYASPESPTSFELFETPEEEADYVAEQILRLKKNYQYSDFAILTRANAHGEVFIRSLIRHGIPYQFLGPGMLLKQPEVKDLIAYLKMLNNIEDSISLYRVLNMYIFNIDIKDLSLLSAFSKKTNLSLFQSCEIYISFFEKVEFQEDYEIYRKYLPLLKSETREKLKYLFSMFRKHLSKVKNDTAGQILYYFLEDTKYLNRLVNYKTESEEKIALNVSKFFNKIKSFETSHDDASVSAVVDYLDMSMELGESPLVSKMDISTYNAVNIVTTHSAKGLEFKVVFLVNLTTGRFPTRQKKEVIAIPEKLIKEILPVGDYHLEEERRLFYVGVTRAMDYVFMTSARFYGEGKRVQKISPFILESLGENIIKKTLNITTEKKQQLSIFDFKKPAETISKEKYLLNNFSYTQLESYVRCPLQYKYQYILKVPTSPTASLSFGDTIHRTLQYFYQEFARDKSVGLPKLLSIFKTAWTPIGYSSKDHEERMKKEGEKLLKIYIEKFHNKSLDILGLEKLFKIKIGKDIFITGKIDRIDKKPDGSIEIIDYKTGKQPKESELKKSFQLSIYAIAATDPGLYNKKLSQVDLTFYYLQTPEKISFKRNSEDLANTKEEIFEIVSDIRKNDFTPRPGPWCDFCAFKMICEAWQ